MINRKSGKDNGWNNKQDWKIVFKKVENNYVS